MNLDWVMILAQTALLLLLSPLLSGVIKNWKAKLQNRRGPPIWQPYFDLAKFLRKDMVISEHASWIFSITPYVLFLTALSAGLMVPLVTARAYRAREDACILMTSGWYKAARCYPNHISPLISLRSGGKVFITPTKVRYCPLCEQELEKEANRLE